MRGSLYVSSPTAWYIRSTPPVYSAHSPKSIIQEAHANWKTFNYLHEHIARAWCRCAARVLYATWEICRTDAECARETGKLYVQRWVVRCHDLWTICGHIRWRPGEPKRRSSFNPNSRIYILGRHTHTNTRHGALINRCVESRKATLGDTHTILNFASGCARRALRLRSTVHISYTPEHKHLNGDI